MDDIIHSLGAYRAMPGFGERQSYHEETALQFGIELREEGWMPVVAYRSSNAEEFPQYRLRDELAHEVKSFTDADSSESIIGPIVDIVEIESDDGMKTMHYKLCPGAALWQRR